MIVIRKDAAHVFFLCSDEAKTQNPSVPESRVEGFVIPSLHDFVSDELLLCPV